MKNFFKSLFLIGALFALSAQAQVSTLVTATSAGITNTIGGGVLRLYSLTFNGTGNFWVYDSASSNTVRITPAYTNVTSYTTNLVSTYVGYYGYTNSVTNTAIQLITNTVARSTNSAPIIYAAGMTTTAQNTAFIPVRATDFGLTVVSTNAGTITVTYSK
jgi:hypothetical protein